MPPIAPGTDRVRPPARTVLVVHSDPSRQQARVGRIVGDDNPTIAVPTVEAALAVLDTHVALVLCEAELSTPALVKRAMDVGAACVLLVKETDWRQVLSDTRYGLDAAVVDDALGIQDVVNRALSPQPEPESPPTPDTGGNRRRHPRVPVSIVAKGGPDRIGAITDLSVGGVFLSTPTMLERTEVIRLEFTLGDRLVRADAEVLQQRGDGWSLRFLGLSHEDLHAFREFLTHQRPGGVDFASEDLPALHERIQDPVRCGNILRSLIAVGASGWVRGPRGDAYAIRPVSYRGNHDPPIVRWVLDEPLPLPLPLFVEVEGPNSRYWFPVFDAVFDGANVDARMGDWFLRTRRRVAVRRPDVRSLSVRFRHPATGALVTGRVGDVSRRGLGFTWSGSEAPLHLGMVLSDFALETDTGLVHLRAEVRSVDGGAADARCGVRAVPLTRADHLAWNAIVNPLLNPTTRLQEGQASEIWQLYVESGYFALSERAPSDFEPLRKQFLETSARLRAAPELGAQVVWPATGPAEATASMLRIYEGTWLGYQMAKRSGPQLGGVSRRSILRDLFVHCYEHALVDPEPKWFVAYYQEDATIGRLTQHAFAERHRGSPLAAIWPFRVWEMPIGVAGPAPSAGVEVGPATPGEIRALLDVIRATRPRAYVEALDLTPDRLHLESLAVEWAGAGLLREREVVVARVEGVARAAAIRESATDGLHLFRLLHCVRIFPLIACDATVVSALLTDCSAWYAGRVRSHWVYIEEAEAVADAATLGARQARDLGRADMVIVAGVLVPDLVEYVFEVTAEREPFERPPIAEGSS